jgi:RHS repeat-associated protein
VTFTLPQGNYRFRADLNGVQSWSAQANGCELPGCTTATVTLPGGTSQTTTTIDYTYDPLYRLTNADYSTGDSYQYSYDSVGNRLTQESMVNGLSSTVNYNYDIANRLEDVNGVAYTYDDNGNLLSDGVNTYAYDSANRLTSVNGTDSSTYNGLGDRLSQDGVNYTLDLNAGLTQVLSDGTTSYIYGIGRISQTNTATEYFLSDALGSVRQLTSQSGQVTYAQNYDPYGVVTQVSGEGRSMYGYTGEQQDGDMVYLRARYLNVANGRFQSRDTWGGSYNSPQSLNRWNYTDSNPVNRIDPSGHCWASDGSWEFKEPWFGNCAQSSTSTSTPSPTPSSTPSGPTITPSSTPSPTCTYIPTPTGAPMQLAMSYLLKYSPLGRDLYNQATAIGVKFVYNTEKCQGYRKGNTIGINPCGTPTYDAGTIAHEMYHLIKNSPVGHGSQLEEYWAMLVGDVVRSDLISQNIGTSADMRNFITDYTVNANNPNQTQLEQDLKAWFKNEPSYNNLRALPPTPTPTSTQTPTSTSTSTQTPTSTQVSTP